jgi:putative redox protein
MNPEIPWDKSRMEFRPVVMDLTYEGGMRFTAASQTGARIPIDAHVHLGGGGQIPNPIEYLFASLGGCVGIKILLSLSDHGIVPDTLEIGMTGTRRQTLPAVFDHVHFVITLRAPVDDGLMNGILDRTMKYLCPVSAMFAEVGEVTFETRINKKEPLAGT